MRINMDCIRDILLCVEENTGLQQRCFFISYDLAKVQELIGLPAIEPAPYQIELEKLYANEDLIYHLKYCFDAGLIEAQDNIPNYQIWVADLTVKGHDFIANIRDDKLWNTIKKVCAEKGVSSIGTLLEVAGTTALKSLVSGISTLL